MTEEEISQIIEEELEELLKQHPLKRRLMVKPTRNAKEAQVKLKRAKLFLEKAYKELLSVSQSNFKPEEIGYWTIFIDDDKLPNKLAREFAKGIFSKF